MPSIVEIVESCGLLHSWHRLRTYLVLKTPGIEIFSCAEIIPTLSVKDPPIYFKTCLLVCVEFNAVDLLPCVSLRKSAGWRSEEPGWVSINYLIQIGWTGSFCRSISNRNDGPRREVLVANCQSALPFPVWDQQPRCQKVSFIIMQVNDRTNDMACKLQHRGLQEDGSFCCKLFRKEDRLYFIITAIHIVLSLAERTHFPSSRSTHQQKTVQRLNANGQL